MQQNNLVAYVFSVYVYFDYWNMYLATEKRVGIVRKLAIRETTTVYMLSLSVYAVMRKC